MIQEPIHRDEISAQTGAGSCDFAPTPVVEIETGNRHAPYIQVHQCVNCGHGITLPAMDDVAPLYEGRESEDFLARDTGWVARLKSVVVARLAKHLIGFANQPRKVADFGTGNGALAAAMADALPEGSEAYGLDFFDDPPGAIGNARYMSFEEARQTQCRFDLVTCFHVLEHDDQPRRILDRIHSMLEPGGVAAVEVPNVDCVWNSWFGKACANWYAPFHRVHFSRKSLAALVATSGFDIIEQRDICGPTIALSLANLTGAKPSAIFFAIGLAFRPVQWLAEKTTRRPSALRIIARKRGVPLP